MRVLDIVKTADGAAWAAKQSRVLTHLGVEVHVALPRLTGRCMGLWEASGAVLHEADLDLPLQEPWMLAGVLTRARRLVAEIQPDIIHSHFFGNTIVLRIALGKRHPVPRIYQVAGPLHLEHALYRRAEIGLAGAADCWIGSSRCIVDHYLRAGVDARRVFLSYYGDEVRANSGQSGVTVRDLACARREDFVVGNISWLYPPKRFLGQRSGLKAHEDIIAALGIVLQKHPRALGVFAGGAWGGAAWYEQSLRRAAHSIAADRIRFLGELPYYVAHEAWRGFDLVVHVPISENCGGVIEPLLAGVPVIASDVGGLPEVIMPGLTGMLTPSSDPRALAEAICDVIANPLRAQEMAARGRELVRVMFDVERTAREVFNIYRFVAGETANRPESFDSRTHLAATARIAAPPLARVHLCELEIES